MRWVVTVALAGMTSSHVGVLTDDFCKSDPPSASIGSNGFPPVAAMPKRVTNFVLEPPGNGDKWQCSQLVSLKIGPRPSAGDRMCVNDARPWLKRSSCAGVRPGSGSPMRGWIGCCALASACVASAKTVKPAARERRDERQRWKVLFMDSFREKGLSRAVVLDQRRKLREPTRPRPRSSG